MIDDLLLERGDVPVSNSTNDIVSTIVKPVAIALIIALILACAALFSDVQANTAYRLSAEKKLDLLVEMNQQLLIISHDVKYIQKDVDTLKSDYKIVSKELQEARSRELQPWKYQSSPE